MTVGEKSFRELLARAEAGEPQAQYDLGLRCLSGQGHPFAQYELGRLYEAGAGVARDLGKALRWYRRAAGDGVHDARARLLDFFAAPGEAAYDRMYEAHGTAATAAYSDAKEAFGDAIVMARLLRNQFP
jgi:TPR repeat protein